ncbi:futalosine hydrolase [Streptomyces daliensis]|uniref:Futalosine hydrolase n=1 Tax=Streptomyces daliensis TaxID=299421 RepID=A0A8T4IYT9_9ACTN|nr:futalosine hydrolase [Streptomyces daliensis]
MNVLVVTAVAPERDAVTRACGEEPGRRALPGGYEAHRVRPADAADDGPGQALPVLDVLAAGVGPAAAAAGTATALTAAAVADEPYGLVVSAGIGGGFAAPGTGTGAVVVASAIVAADLGARTAEGFAPVTALGFGTDTHHPPAGLVRAAAGATGAVTGPVLTVSTVTGTAERAAELAALHPGAAAEAMEGFGVAEAAAAHGVPVLEIRTVSNPVGPRDRAAWRIPEALGALGGAFEALLPVLRAWKA